MIFKFLPQFSHHVLSTVCRAFSTVETIESMVAIQANSSGNPPRLSVQELIDCDESSRGCQGGDLCQATLWAQQVGREKHYHYFQDMLFC